MFHAWMSACIAAKDRALTRGLAVMRDDTGQDLIEYALVAALIALGSVASMRGLATSIGSALARVGTSLSGAI